MAVKKIMIIGGGTMNHIRNHLSICAPAYGTTGCAISSLMRDEIHKKGLQNEYRTILRLTKMAAGDWFDVEDGEAPETNEDVAALVDKWIADPDVRAIIFNVALADFTGQIGDVPSGKHAERLKTSNGPVELVLTPAEKLIGKIRKTRKDIFLVGFKTTTGATSDEQYKRGLELLKTNSINLVLANDTVTRNNMIITPEESRYAGGTDRTQALSFLVKMTLSRMQNRFTRSTVVPGEAVPWESPDIPENLRDVVNHCIQAGAYKPVLGKTVGHFALKVKDGEIITSIRKSNFNELDKTGMVRVESKNDDEVIAHGFRPSVGGQSQRIIFAEHPDKDCIVHFHCPPKPEVTDIPVEEQWPNECGSHQCGANTSRGLKQVDLGDGDSLSVVMLDNHGPNIVFSRNTPAVKVKQFIDTHFDLSAKTGGIVLQ